MVAGTYVRLGYPDGDEGEFIAGDGLSDVGPTI